MSAPRERLPGRRAHEAIAFRHAGFDYTAGIGRNSVGDLAEIFLSAAKSGSLIEAWARDSAILASIALQHGVTADTIRHALSRDGFDKASTPLCELLDLLADQRGNR